jgi:hypothetical protein
LRMLTISGATSTRQYVPLHRNRQIRPRTQPSKKPWRSKYLAERGPLSKAANELDRTQPGLSNWAASNRTLASRCLSGRIAALSDRSRHETLRPAGAVLQRDRSRYRQHPPARVTQRHSPPGVRPYAQPLLAAEVFSLFRQHAPVNLSLLNRSSPEALQRRARALPDVPILAEADHREINAHAFQGLIAFSANARNESERWGKVISAGDERLD